MPIQNTLFRKKSEMQLHKFLCSLGHSSEKEENKLAISNVLMSFWGCYLAMSQFEGHLSRYTSAIRFNGDTQVLKNKLCTLHIVKGKYWLYLRTFPLLQEDTVIMYCL